MVEEIRVGKGWMREQGSCGYSAARLVTEIPHNLYMNRWHYGPCECWIVGVNDFCTGVTIHVVD